MDKTETQMMKGVAILLMIFLHLFNQSHNVDLCRNYVYIDGIPLVHILSRAANPVAFFLILGGFGLYKVYEKGDEHRWKRLIKLMIHHWVVLAIFVTLGHFINPIAYPGSWKQILSNVTGYENTYNGEMWFLLPYVILSACSPWIFKILSKFHAITIIITTLFIYLCTSYCISRYGMSFFVS
ncbi:MAG: acyltransferase [Bacteroidaceae bacterium]|nr:acyltransferase [Bacteroidaceae bacterium]